MSLSTLRAKYVRSLLVLTGLILPFALVFRGGVSNPASWAMFNSSFRAACFARFQCFIKSVLFCAILSPIAIGFTWFVWLSGGTLLETMTFLVLAATAWVFGLAVSATRPEQSPLEALAGIYMVPR